MARILPKDCKRDIWAIILLSVAFLVVASLSIYAVVASTKNDSGNNGIALKKDLI